MNIQVTSIILLTLVISVSVFQAYSYTQTLLSQCSKTSTNELYNHAIELSNAIEQSLIYGKYEIMLPKEIYVNTSNYVLILEITVDNVTTAFYEISYTPVILASKCINVTKVTAVIEINDGSKFLIRTSDNNTFTILPYVRVKTAFSNSTMFLNIMIPIIKCTGSKLGEIFKLRSKGNGLEDNIFVDKDSTLSVVANGTIISSFNIQSGTIVQCRVTTPEVTITRI